MNFAALIQTASTLPTDASGLESAISALEKKIKALESSSIPLEHSLPWFTGVVAFGVAMELWIIWHGYRDEMEAWHLGTVDPPEKPSIIKFVVEVASVLLITGGIIGELWAGLRITSINGKLRTETAELRSKSDQLLALVTEEAGDAKNSAKEGKDAADDARADADELRSFTVQLSDALRPESLSPEELKKMTEEFRAFAKPGIPIKIITTEGPAEKLAISVSVALKDAGFSEPAFEVRPALSPEIAMGAPIQPLEYWKTMESIEGPIIKRFGIWGPLHTLPPGSPITIWVGETLPGKIPKIPRLHKQLESKNK